MSNLTYAELDENLQTDIGDDTAGFRFYSLSRTSRAGELWKYHVAFNPYNGRAGVVYVGSGSSGITGWMCATSPEDALDRFVNDRCD